MRAAILDKGRVSAGELADPVPAAGQVLVRTRRCAVCASDAHFVCSGAEIIRQSREFGGGFAGIDLDRPIVMGHEYVGEIVDYGPGSTKPLRTGTRVTSIPVMRVPDKGFDIIGYSNTHPGGFGEYMLLDEAMLMEVPADVSDDFAALVEPLAVGLEHARAGDPRPGDVALVIGCGAIGLSVIAGLRLNGIEAIIASDLDPGRRAIALQMGAALAVDPREDDPYGADGILGAPNLVYECVGKKGILAQIIRQVGRDTRIVVGGYSLEPELVPIAPSQDRRLRIHFASGEEPQDMHAAMRAIADGTVDLSAWLGETVGLSGVARAIDEVADPTLAVRTLVDPGRA